MLWKGFVRSAKEFPRRPALAVGGRTVSYEVLYAAAAQIAATLQALRPPSAMPLTAVFAARGLTAFSGILGALLSGHGYVPLSPSAPPDRVGRMFRRSGCRSVIVDAAGAVHLAAILDGAEPVLVVVPESSDVDALRDRWPEHTFRGAAHLTNVGLFEPSPDDPDAVAYLLFTSGSTGVPKGVMVSHRNVTTFVSYMAELYGITEHDRFSQMFQLTFDLSVFDMFVCWERGACLCCPSAKALMNPGRFISIMAPTVWFSVPSTVAFMKQFGMLKPGAFPSLRWSLFCGEPLPLASTAAWQKAAPNSSIENLYGPTELTIACTRFRWNESVPSTHCELGIVPIGTPFPGMAALVVDEELREVGPGETGELLMTGPQMSLGYLDDPGKTAIAFVAPPGRTDVYYRTGDRVRCATVERPMTHLGRLDFQVKILGHRVELGEIEAVMREESGLPGVVAIGWPVTESGFGGVEAFVEGDIDVAQLRTRASMRLPDYMTPRRIHAMAHLPRNSSDKVDRQALTKWLGEQDAAS